jgi:SAM-dependent methyltransferase
MHKYFETNRARWDESVGIHLNSQTGFYPVDEFRAGKDVLDPIESDEIGDVAGKALLHLQCHFGLDTLCLARRGAVVTGLDFSPKAIAAARALADDCGVAATFVEGNLYDAPALIAGRFDIVYVTWGAIIWLPDIARWAEVVAHFLEPGGFLYLLEDHPAASALDQAEDGRLVSTYPYFQGAEPLRFDDAVTYTGDTARLENTRSYEWNHSLSSIVNGLIGAGLRLDCLNEYDRVGWQKFPGLVADDDGMYRLPPGMPSVPLAFSLKASKA